MFTNRSILRRKVLQLDGIKGYLQEYKELIIIILASTFITYFYIFVSFAMARNSFPREIFNMWHIYDACHYLNIAIKGYGTTEDTRVLIVFFPLYPALIKTFNILFNNYLVSALVISNIAYAFSVIYLYKLVLLDEDRDVAVRAVIYYSIFPTAYYLHGAYTESLFMALIVACFFYARKKNWLAAGILGMFVTATRLTGIVIFLALLVEYFHQKKWKISDVKPNILFLGIVPLGLAGFLLINYMVFGHPFQFLSLEKEVWYKTLQSPIRGFLGAWGSISWKEPHQIITSALSEIVFVVFVLGCIIWMIFKYRPIYLTYSWLTWFILVSNDYWLSMPRYMLMIFPIYIIMAKWGKNKGVDFAIMFFFILFFALFGARYTQGYWTF